MKTFTFSVRLSPEALTSLRELQQMMHAPSLEETLCELIKMRLQEREVQVVTGGYGGVDA